MNNGISRFLAPLIILQFFLLVVQFIIGMWINLFAPMNVPAQPYGHMMGGYFMSIMVQIPEVMVHMMIGFLIGLLSLIILIISFFTKRLSIIVLLAINGFLVLIAGIYGLIFLLGGLQNNVQSFIMAMGFIGAVSSDFGTIYFL